MSSNFIINSLSLIVVAACWLGNKGRVVCAWFILVSGLGSLYDLVFKFVPSGNVHGEIAAFFWIFLGSLAWSYIRKNKEHLFLAVFLLVLLLGATDRSTEFVNGDCYSWAPDSLNNNRPWWLWTHRNVLRPLVRRYSGV